MEADLRTGTPETARPRHGQARDSLLRRALQGGPRLTGALDLLATAMSVALEFPEGLVCLCDGDDQHVVGYSGPSGAQTGLTPGVRSLCAAVVGQAAAVTVEAAPDADSFGGDPAPRQVGSYAGVPIVLDGRVIGSLCGIDPTARTWTAHDLATLDAFAELAGYLITARLQSQGELLDERASAQARGDRQDAELTDYAQQVSEHESVEALSRRLQNALLPQSTPPGNRVIDTFYEPGSERLLLGGDFADTMRDLEDNLNFVIGDVTGHGPEAAALAISLRASWNALQGVGIDQTEIIAELDRQAGRSGLFATVLIGRIESDGHLCLVGAGHPPPIIISDAGPHELEMPTGPMLGIGLSAPAWPVAHHDLGGDELIAYTDGLIEGHVGADAARWEVGGLLEAIRVHGGDPAMLCRLATAANRHPLPDDVAIMRIRSKP